MVDSREKGARAESKVRDTLRELTKLQWERTPGSGALDEKHGLKGDLYVPSRTNLYCVEVKHYEDDHLTSKVLTDKSPQLLDWWKQCIRQASQVKRIPLLIFKHNRGKLFAAFNTIPSSSSYRHVCITIDINTWFYVALLEDYIKYEQIEFVK